MYGVHHGPIQPQCTCFSLMVYWHCYLWMHKYIAMPLILQINNLSWLSQQPVFICSLIIRSRSGPWYGARLYCLNCWLLPRYSIHLYFANLCVYQMKNPIPRPAARTSIAMMQHWSIHGVSTKLVIFSLTTPEIVTPGYKIIVMIHRSRAMLGTTQWQVIYRWRIHLRLIAWSVNVHAS